MDFNFLFLNEIDRFTKKYDFHEAEMYAYLSEQNWNAKAHVHICDKDGYWSKNWN